MSQATLHWTSDKGFSLDLDSSEDDVTVRFMGVTVPVDGTESLRAEPVGLYSMDMLFNTHVDVGHAPGQLHSSTVMLDGDHLVLKADLEDAETGQQRSWTVRVPVVVPASAPAIGGFVAKEPVEDDLDWEDDGDFDMPADMPTMPSKPSADGMATATGGGGDVGMEALLRSLMKSGPPEAAATDFDEPDDAALAALEAEESEEDEEDAGDGDGISSALLAALLGGGEDEEEDSPGDDLDHAINFLQLLVNREGLALEPGFTVQDLAAGAAPILMSGGPAERVATKLSNWLLEQDSVEELYIDDESLETLLEQW
ncbi:MAG: hypothetical protein ACJAZO_001745 [Myxococcota bacterium]|jgi:hypothetical protein